MDVAQVVGSPLLPEPLVIVTVVLVKPFGSKMFTISRIRNVVGLQ
jgi:hypothetical protein